MRFLLGKKNQLILLYAVLLIEFKGQYTQHNILAAIHLLSRKLELVPGRARNKGKEKDLNLNDLLRQTKSKKRMSQPEVCAALT